MLDINKSIKKYQTCKNKKCKEKYNKMRTKRGNKFNINECKDIFDPKKYQQCFDKSEYKKLLDDYNLCMNSECKLESEELDKIIKNFEDLQKKHEKCSKSKCSNYVDEYYKNKYNKKFSKSEDKKQQIETKKKLKKCLETKCKTTKTLKQIKLNKYKATPDAREIKLNLFAMYKKFYDDLFK